jgi:hypothetical protein
MLRFAVSSCGLLWLVALCASSLQGAPLWLAVTHTTKRTGANFYPEIVQTQAEQATVAAEKTGAHAYGYNGSTNLETRRLQFVCRGKTYAVPEGFVADLLWLGVDSSVRASLNGKDAVFAMPGGSGKTVYTVYFHFRDDRFFQRILNYSDVQTILIRTNEAAPPR